VTLTAGRTDAASLNDNIENVNRDLQLQRQLFCRNGVGHLVYDSREALLLNTGSRATRSTSARFSAAPQISVNGNIVPIHVVDMNGSTGPVTFTAAAGGRRSLQLSELQRLGPPRTRLPVFAISRYRPRHQLRHLDLSVSRHGFGVGTSIQSNVACRLRFWAGQ